MFLYTVVDILYTGKIMLLRNIAIGVALYFCVFMIASLIAFVFEVYSVLLVYVTISVIALIALAGIYIVKYRCKYAFKNIEKVKYFPLCLLIILAVGFLFSFQKFEMFGMGQDQGVYQMNALLMIDGLNSNVVPVKEYELLTNEGDRQIFMQSLQSQYLTLPGFYFAGNNENRGTIPPGTNPPNSAIFHGLQNLPALLSIGGMILGTEYLMHILTIPYLITIILIFLTLNVNFGFSKLTSSIPTLIYALSPVVLWTSKASLTEIFLSMIIALFIFYLTSKEKTSSWLLWVPTAAFAFFHVSIYVVMPMFMILFIGLALYKKDVGAWFSGLMTVIFFAVGYLVMTFVAPQYTFGNYMPLVSIFESLRVYAFDDNASQYWLVFPVCIATIGFMFVLRYYVMKKDWSGYKIKKVLPVIIIVLTIICIISIIIAWHSMAFNYSTLPNEGFHGGGRLNIIPNLTIFAIAFGTGFVLCIVIITNIFRREKCFYVKKTFPLTFMVFYTALFIPSFLMVGMPYYYYFARYIVPYVPALVVLGGVTISGFRTKNKIILAAVSFCLILPFSITLALNRDISHMEIASQQEIVEVTRNFEPGSIIVVDDGLRRFFVNNISFSTESYIFPYHVYVQLADIPSIDERNIYQIFLSYETADLSDRNIIHSVVSQSGNIDFWESGWKPGPLNLLSPRTETYLINIEVLS